MGYAIHEFSGGTTRDHDHDHDGAWPARFPAIDEAVLDGALIDGTTLATENGWQPVETLKPGDRVRVRGGGLRSLRQVERHSLWSVHGFPRRVWPLRIPPDVLGNATPMLLLPRQRVPVEQPDGMLQACRLEGLGGVTACPPGREIAVTWIAFDAPELVLANYGAALECPGPGPGRGPNLGPGRETAGVVPVRCDAGKPCQVRR